VRGARAKRFERALRGAADIFIIDRSCGATCRTRLPMLLLLLLR